MTKSDMCAIVAVSVACSMVLFMATAFVPLGAQPNSARLLRGQSAGRYSESTAALAFTTAGAVIAAAAVVAAIRRRTESTCSVVRHGAARDLAVAYEDSGISLLDNGKFAQGLLGSEGAWGRYEFDPIGFSKYTELVPYLREAEIKHGRVAMLAWLGLVVPDFVRIPGERYSFEAVPVTIDAHDALNGATGVDVQVLLWIAVVEFCCAKKVFEWNSLEVAGDYGLRQLFPGDEEGQKKMRISELKNGRLAMVAFGGAITQAVITRHPFPWLF